MKVRGGACCLLAFEVALTKDIQPFLAPRAWTTVVERHVYFDIYFALQIVYPWPMYDMVTKWAHVDITKHQKQWASALIYLTKELS